MRRLLRTIITLLAINAVCIAVVIASNFSNSAWGCVRFYEQNLGQMAIDFETGTALPDQSFVGPSNVFSPYTNEQLIYDYVSPTNVHRIGIVSTQSTPSHIYLDYAESSTFFALQQFASPDSQILPIITFDQLRQTQTVTLYTTSTLTPLVSVIQTGAVFPASYSEANDYFRGSWSPNGAWFGFLTQTGTQIMTTLISPKSGEHISFPLSGKSAMKLFDWATTSDAVAIGDGEFVDIYATDDDDWARAKSFHLKVDDSDSILLTERWLQDQHTLLLNKRPKGNVDIMSLTQNFIFSVDSQRMESNDFTNTNPISLHFHDQWYCDVHHTDEQSALIPLSGDYAPILLSNQQFGGCNYQVENRSGTKLITRIYSLDDGQANWVSITTDPVTVTPISLPTTVQRVIGWLDEDSVLLYLPDAHDDDVNHGRFGIFDVESGHWFIIPEAITIDKLLAISPDSTRFIAASADKYNLLLFTVQGELLAMLPTNNQVSAGIWWSPDSAKFMITEMVTRPLRGLLLTTYDRNGKQLVSIHQPTYYSGSIGGWSHCEPSAKVPRLSLPQ